MAPDDFEILDSALVLYCNQLPRHRKILLLILPGLASSRAEAQRQCNGQGYDNAHGEDRDQEPYSPSSRTLGISGPVTIILGIILEVILGSAEIEPGLHFIARRTFGLAQVGQSLGWDEFGGLISDENLHSGEAMFMFRSVHGAWTAGACPVRVVVGQHAESARLR